jgi:hypothetical protein
MALTLKLVRTSVQGNTRVNYYDATFDASYATGGLALKPSDVGLSRIVAVDASPVGGRSFPYVASTGKLQAFGGTTEVTNTTDLSAVTTRLSAEGV